MASHYFQYMYVGYNGFRWPNAHYATNNVNGHSIYLMFWPLLDELSGYGFNVNGLLMDGSNNNHQFRHLLLNPESARLLKYPILNPYALDSSVALIQGCKHVIKKVRNGLLSSHRHGNCVRQLKLHGQYIFWEYFEVAFNFNCQTDLHLYRKLNKDHIKVSDAGKMLNHLVINVLN